MGWESGGIGGRDTGRDSDQEGPGALEGACTTKGGRWLGCGVREEQNRKKVKGKVAGAEVR